MITPTVGRVVWYWSDVKQQVQPFAATVAYVHGDRMVNLSVVDSNGIQFAKQSVVLVQDGDVRPEREFCEWMPYQKSVAKGEIAPVLHAHPAGSAGYDGGPVGLPSTSGPITETLMGVAGAVPHDPGKPTL